MLTSIGDGPLVAFAMFAFDDGAKAEVGVCDAPPGSRIFKPETWCREFVGDECVREARFVFATREHAANIAMQLVRDLYRRRGGEKAAGAAGVG